MTKSLLVERNIDNIQMEVMITRKLLRLTQNEFAKMIGTTNRTISAIEVGGALSKDMAARIYVELLEYLESPQLNSILKPEQQDAILHLLRRLRLHIKKGSDDSQSLKKPRKELYSSNLNQN